MVVLRCFLGCAATRASNRRPRQLCGVGDKRTITQQLQDIIRLSPRSLMTIPYQAVLMAFPDNSGASSQREPRQFSVQINILALGRDAAARSERCSLQVS